MRGDELKWISQKKSGLKRIDDVKWTRLKCAVLGVEELGRRVGRVLVGADPLIKYWGRHRRERGIRKTGEHIDR